MTTAAAGASAKTKAAAEPVAGGPAGSAPAGPVGVLSRPSLQGRQSAPVGVVERSLQVFCRHARASRGCSEAQLQLAAVHDYQQPSVGGGGGTSSGGGEVSPTVAAMTATPPQPAQPEDTYATQPEESYAAQSGQPEGGYATPTEPSQAPATQPQATAQPAAESQAEATSEPATELQAEVTATPTTEPLAEATPAPATEQQPQVTSPPVTEPQPTPAQGAQSWDSYASLAAPSQAPAARPPSASAKPPAAEIGRAHV